MFDFCTLSKLAMGPICKLAGAQSDKFVLSIFRIFFLCKNPVAGFLQHKFVLCLVKVSARGGQHANNSIRLLCWGWVVAAGEREFSYWLAQTFRSHAIWVDNLDKK